MQPSTTSNFYFLKEHDPLFFELAHMAEYAFTSDPNTTLIKLRQLSEAFTKEIATLCHIHFDEQTSQAELIHQISTDLHLDAPIRNLFHTLRIEGNKAAHEFKTDHKTALNGLKLAHSLAIWFHQSFGNDGHQFKAKPFVSPKDPSIDLQALQHQINQLKAKNQQLEGTQELISLLSKEKQEYARLAEQMNQEASHLAKQLTQKEQLLQEQQDAFEMHLKLLQLELTEQAAKNPSHSERQQQVISTQIQEANQHILTEELVRLVIDQQLISAGWLADSLNQTWDNGCRPEVGKNKAISNYPIFYQGQSAYADYILFCGLIPIAIIEAKCENINIADKIRQAELYAKGFNIEPLMQPAWQQEQRQTPWQYNNELFTIPFVYSCNGRPYNTSLEEKSGTWFRDIRIPNNLAKALQHFHTPTGLLEKLTQAAQKLTQQPFLDTSRLICLRSYQRKAIHAIETALIDNHRNCLVAMATGTGKSFTLSQLAQHFIITKRFQRILILIDRTALGLNLETKLIQEPANEALLLADFYKLSDRSNQWGCLKDQLQCATVQTMVKQVFASDTPPSIDNFDCILIDEAHSGYILEHEMLEGELATRDSQRYIHEYHQLLHYFDAPKIGFTATPTSYTEDIFGQPIYSYSYQEAVADDYLLNYEPPIIYQTQLTQQGIHYPSGQTLQIINHLTGDIETTTLTNDIELNTAQFNRFIINKSFNHIICEQLSQELNPFSEQKTLIFCSSDLHADMVKGLLDHLFTQLYTEAYDQRAVAKITAATFQAEQLIEAFHYQRYPNIAITVDLLATGIQIPKVSHLVFLRHVKSNILFEKMLGRASLPCEEIDKKSFRLYDAIGIYQLLDETYKMQPLTKVNHALEELITQLTHTKTLKRALNTADPIHKTLADQWLSRINQHLIKLLYKADYHSEKDTSIKAKLDELTISWSVHPKQLPTYLHQLGAKKAADFFKRRKTFLHELKQLNLLMAKTHVQILSEHPDSLVSRNLHYGKHTDPNIFLESFITYIKKQINHSELLSLTLTTPNNINKTQLKAIRLMLDNEGYSEINLQAAWRNKYHQIIDAGLIGYIRYAAIDETLIPFEDRVQKALQQVYTISHWNTVQQQWLNHLAEHLMFKEILDKPTIDQYLLTQHSSITQLDKLLNHQLDAILDTLKMLWSEPESKAPEPLKENHHTPAEEKELISANPMTLLSKIKRFFGF